MADKPEFEVEGLPLREHGPDAGKRFDELVAARPYPQNAVASYHACGLREEPKVVSYESIAELEAADLPAEILGAAPTHSHVLIEVAMEQANLQAVAEAMRLINRAAQLFGLGSEGMGEKGRMLYVIRLYTYAEVPIEPEIEAAVDAMLVGHGREPLSDEDAPRVLH